MANSMASAIAPAMATRWHLPCVCHMATRWQLVGRERGRGRGRERPTAMLRIALPASRLDCRSGSEAAGSTKNMLTLRRPTDQLKPETKPQTARATRSKP